MELFFMLFGLGFFTWVIQYTARQSDKDYERTLNERREFGVHRPQKKRRLRL